MWDCETGRWQPRSTIIRAFERVKKSRAPRKGVANTQAPSPCGRGLGGGVPRTQLGASLRSITALEAEGLDMAPSERARADQAPLICQDLARHRPSPYPLPQGEGARELFGIADFFIGSKAGRTKEGGPYPSTNPRTSRLNSSGISQKTMWAVGSEA
ncbi:hypothetical protein FRZ61_41020 [Hypericibacter adhaerens]|uniref:Uncharacterized protein n=1 Tax=Hypericibacter adhaerens TaxID=2602016 RepID=A0A5J6N329_9PROT|nr:hypothetical protein FRZ61_41020 [Hypericibacter adhaerens]